eukprot:s5137_g3.t2
MVRMIIRRCGRLNDPCGISELLYSVFQTGPQQGAKSKKKRCANPTKICVALPLATVLCELAVRPANVPFGYIP